MTRGDAAISADTPRRLSVLFVGDARRPEFRETASDLSTRTILAALGTPGEAVDRLAADGAEPADLIVLAQAYAGEFAAAEVDRLRALAPLARLVALVGPWCAAETRSGRPWPGLPRVAWHQWPLGGRRLLEALARAAGPWALPATATEEERLLADAADATRQLAGEIGILAAWRASAEWLAAVVRQAGGTPRVLDGPPGERASGLTAAIWDAHHADAAAARASLRSFCETVSPAPVAALVGFPRVEDREAALAAGAASVLAKPLAVADLVAALAGGWGRSGVRGAKPPAVERRHRAQDADVI